MQSLTSRTVDISKGKRRSLTTRLVTIATALLLLVTMKWLQAKASDSEIKTHTGLSDTLSAAIKGGHSLRHLLAENETEICAPAAIEQFPRPVLFSQEQRQNGAIIIHIILMVIMFVALSIVCEEYFVPACQMISSRLEMKSDVAGATFMAAGSSAPELATSVIGVFVAKDDIALGSVVGSSVFNTFLVISFSALFAGSVISLSWWPLVRDCFFYALGIIALVVIISDSSVYWYEATALLILYALYIVVMYNNDKLEAFFRPGIPGVVCCRRRDSIDSEKIIPANEKTDLVNNHDPSHLEVSRQKEETDLEKTTTEEHAGCCQIFLGCLRWPLDCLLKYTIPNCRMHGWKNYFILTFSISIIWIGVFSYIMVWMIALIGYTFSIPDTVMAMTLIAAGGSIPDLIASVIVVREGYGDMAVSNALGSNVFDIFMCLGIPWFMSCVIIDRAPITIYSGGLMYSSIGLMFTVAILLIGTHLNGWKLNKFYGYMLLLGYIVFNVIACLYELNVFGDVNPPTCSSDY